MSRKLEVIGFNIESCALAQAAGAARIELCDNPGDGGTTASYGFIKAARKLLTIELYPIIRPRGGDFLYSDAEFKIMKTDVQLCKELGCDGLVIGMLHADGSVDKERCKQLVDIAYPLGVTFHRAFDRANDPFIAMEDIIDIGCERILTSGQKPSAPEATELIKALIEQADDRIIIMPGSGVRSDNILMLAEKTGAAEFHTSARIMTDSKMNFTIEAMHENLDSVLTDAAEVRKIIALLKQYSTSENVN
jgi:copper homeostasis protein